MGLCEEHDLAVIDRHLQCVLHRPTGRIASTELLAQAISREGFDSIYPVPAWT
jgi:acyl-CoA dehydrogenase